MADYTCLGTENYDDILDANVDFKSPVDEFLMSTLRNNQRFLKCQTEANALSGGQGIEFKVNGNFDNLTLPADGVSLDAGFVTEPLALSKCKMFVKDQGSGGTFTFDIQREKYLRVPIYQIIEIFSANTQSVDRGSAALLTQTVVRSEAQLSTQTIEFAYASENIDNIIQVQGSALFQINFDPSVDLTGDEYEIGNYIDVSGCTNAGNNGVFQIYDRNRCDGSNIVVQNASGVDESTSPGSIKANIAKYTLTVAAPVNFSAGEQALFASHTDASNDGTLEIFKTNVAGNNILVKGGATAIVTQGSAAGTIDTNRWRYSFTVTANDAFVVGEVAEFTSHTSANNDGSFEILSKNDDSAFNVTVYNVNGVVQGGVAGQVDTNRWVYNLNLDPAGFFVVGDTAVMASHTDPNNDGNFTLVDVKYLGNNNVVVYNASGAVQAGVAGTVDHLQKAITFRADQSANFTTGKSSVTVVDTANAGNEGDFLIVDQNRAAISNYNIIVEMPSYVEQLGDAGCIEKEVRSIFTDGAQSVTVNQNRQVFDFDDKVATDTLADQTILSLNVTAAPSGCDTASWNLE